MKNITTSIKNKLSDEEIALAIETMHELASIAEKLRDGQFEDADWRDLDGLIEDAKRLYQATQK